MIFICLLSFIPWPIPNSVTIRCSRDNSRIVKRVVQTKLSPIFDKYHYELPLECPFHPQRDLFAPQESAKKQNRPTQWQCGFCGKSFYEERYLDVHFDNRHRSEINIAEDAICLADFCDIFRCDVLVSKDSTLGSFSQSTTDIELYNEATALAAARREVINSKMGIEAFKNLPPSIRDKLNDLFQSSSSDAEQKDTSSSTDSSSKDKIHKRRLRNVCRRKSSGDDKGEQDDGQCDEAMKLSTYSRISDSQRKKASCKNEEVQKIKSRCEILIRSCIAGALANLTVEEFKNMEGEVARIACQLTYIHSCVQFHFRWDEQGNLLVSHMRQILGRRISTATLSICSRFVDSLKT